LEAAWAGGAKGREVMDRLFVQVVNLLSDAGLFYVVVVKDNQLGASVCVLSLSQCLLTSDVASSISALCLSDAGMQLFTHLLYKHMLLQSAAVTLKSYSPHFPPF